MGLLAITQNTTLVTLRQVGLYTSNVDVLFLVYTYVSLFSK